MTEMQNNRRVLCLTRTLVAREPRSWHFHVRWGALMGGKKKQDLDPGTWLLELGPKEVWLGDDKFETEYLYRLASGQVVALERPPGDDEVVEVAEPQAIVALNAYRSLDEFLVEDMGIELERVQPGLPPFALIKCPLCGSVDFATLDLASAWCQGCNANFHVRTTAGDPGWVLDVTWKHVNFGAARYIMPKVESLMLHMVLKNTGDPRDLRYNPEDSCGYFRQCQPDSLYLTGPDDTLRPGLHVCRIGDVYGWKLTGAIPTPREVQNASAWTIEKELWPWCATLQKGVLCRFECKRVRKAITALQQMDDEGLAGSIGALERLVRIEKGSEDPTVWVESLPPLSQLGEGERYLLHHWLIHKDWLGRAWPVWYVVTPIVDENRWLTGWRVVRKDVCPRCGQQVRDDIVHHSVCHQFWQESGWAPSDPDPEEAQRDVAEVPDG